MADVKPVVSLTNATVENMSRHDMLEWVNETVNGKYKKIEELCSGIAYCQMMELLFPHCIGLKKVKMSAKLDHEHLHNLKLFQAAFTRLKLDKSVPIDRLLKARFQDNFEFLQWFKKFFDTHAAGKENLRVHGAPENVPKPIRRPVASTVAVAAAGATQPHSEKSSKTDTPTQTHTTKTPKSGSSTHSREERSRSVSPGTLNVLQESKEQLTKQIGAVEHERDCYYNKLLEIEKLLNKSIADQVSVEWCQRILNAMYAVDDDNGGDMPDIESADL